MRSFIVLLLLIVSLFAKERYSVDELIVKAFQNSPDIDINRLNLEAAKKRYDQAFGGYLPRIDLSADATYIKAQDIPILPNIDTSDTLITGQLSINQLVYDFGKTSGNIEANKENVKSFDARLKEQLVRKKRDVKIAYYDILKKYALIEVNKESITLNEAQLERAKRYFEAGIRTKIDISDAKVRLVRAEITLKNSLYDLQNAYAALDRIVGFNSAKNDYEVLRAPLRLTNDLIDSLPKYDLTLKEAIDYAYENRPELMSYRFEKSIKQKLEKTASATYYPQIKANANYVNTQADKNEWLNNEQYAAGVYLNWNLYSGGSDRARKQEARINTQKALKNLEQAKLFVKEEVTKAFIALHKTKEQVRLRQNLLQLSQEKFEQVTKQYEHGLSDYIELQEARQSYIDAKSGLVISYYDYFAALAALDATLGR